MNIHRISIAFPALLSLALVVAACGGAAAPAATSAPPTSAPPTTAPTTVPTPPPPTATPSPAPTKPAASLSDIMARARTSTEYSYEMRMSGVESATGKAFVKGTKTRQELAVQGQQLVLIVDSAAKTAVTLFPDQKQAMKMDFNLATAQAPRYDSLVASDARFVGNETIDGKPAAVYEQTGAIPGKFWIWIERGLPLKAEVPAGSAKQVIEFTNYQFGSQPDSLFEVPAGYQTTELPAGFPAPGAGGATTTPGGSGAPAIPTIPGLPGGIAIPTIPGR